MLPPPPPPSPRSQLRRVDSARFPPSVSPGVIRCEILAWSSCPFYPPSLGPPHLSPGSPSARLGLALPQIILIIAAVISLALGIYTSVGAEPTLDSFGNPEPKVDWVEGLAILIAVAIVVLVGSVNDWQKEKQFQKLNEKKDDRMCNVLRDGGERQTVNTKDLVVGDVCVLEPGEILPVDGLYLRGHGVKCDESSVTGESDLVKKTSYDEHKDCFLLSGSKVTDGVGEYVVIAVGQHSFNGRVMMSLRGDAESTPLQLKLNRLAELIAKLGALSGLTLFVALMIRFFVQLGTDPNRTAQVKAESFIQILIISVTLVVVAVPEGLPLAVTLALGEPPAFPLEKRCWRASLLTHALFPISLCHETHDISEPPRPRTRFV